jgi:hypothetical protein
MDTAKLIFEGFVGVNGGELLFVMAVAFWKLLHGKSVLDLKHEAALFLGASIAIALVVAAGIWDANHDNHFPYAQFPFAWRLAGTLTAIPLLDYGTWPILLSALRGSR